MDGGGETTTRTTSTSTSTSSGDASGRATTRATSATSGAGNTSAEDVSAAFALTLSVVSSVSIVIVNKHLISILGFREGETASSSARSLSVLFYAPRARRATRSTGGCFAETFPE